MSGDEPQPGVCRQISEQLPWYVNGTLGDVERHRVDAHLLRCASCRKDLAIDRLVYQGMRAETELSHVPAASFKKLQAQLDTLDSMQPSHATSLDRRRKSLQWPTSLVASLASLALAIGLLVGDWWAEYRSVARYHTVTTGSPRAPGAVIRAVFSTAVTPAELQSVLTKGQLRIVSGPTEGGVYSLALTSAQPVSSVVAALRADPQVRFAESIQLGVAAGITQ